jgi:hypothetical protein
MLGVEEVNPITILDVDEEGDDDLQQGKILISSTKDTKLTSLDNNQDGLLEPY